MRLRLRPRKVEVDVELHVDGIQGWRRREESGGTVDTLAEELRIPMQVELKRGFPLYRSLAVHTAEENYNVVYNGWHCTPSVYVNRRLVTPQDGVSRSDHQFQFIIGGQTALLQVSTWFWLGFRSFALTIDGRLCYEEYRPLSDR